MSSPSRGAHHCADAEVQTLPSQEVLAGRPGRRLVRAGLRPSQSGLAPQRLPLPRLLRRPVWGQGLVSCLTALVLSPALCPLHLVDRKPPPLWPCCQGCFHLQFSGLCESPPSPPHA